VGSNWGTVTGKGKHLVESQGGRCSIDTSGSIWRRTQVIFWVSRNKKRKRDLDEGVANKSMECNQQKNITRPFGDGEVYENYLFMTGIGTGRVVSVGIRGRSRWLNRSKGSGGRLKRGARHEPGWIGMKTKKQGGAPYYETMPTTFTMGVKHTWCKTRGKKIYTRSPSSLSQKR